MHQAIKILTNVLEEGDFSKRIPISNLNSNIGQGINTINNLMDRTEFIFTAIMSAIKSVSQSENSDIKIYKYISVYWII